MGRGYTIKIKIKFFLYQWVPSFSLKEHHFQPMWSFIETNRMFFAALMNYNASFIVLAIRSIDISIAGMKRERRV